MADLSCRAVQGQSPSTPRPEERMSAESRGGCGRGHQTHCRLSRDEIVMVLD